MKKLNNVLLAALIALLALPVVGAETASSKYVAPEVLSAPITKYEINIDRKIVKDPRSLLAKIEAAEGFKASACAQVDSRKKGVFLYTCQKVTCQTSEAFNSIVGPGVKLTMAIAACPRRCHWATECSANGTYTCCRNAVPNEVCPGFDINSI